MLRDVHWLAPAIFLLFGQCCLPTALGAGDAESGLKPPPPIMRPLPAKEPVNGTTGPGRTIVPTPSSRATPIPSKSSIGSKLPSSTSGPAAEPAATPAANTLDTIILVNKQSFRGTVLASRSTTETIAINTGSGIMQISRSLVAPDGIIYGLTSRMAQVKSDDLEGLVDLAHWCRAERFNAEALLLLNKAVSLPGCTIASRGLRALLIDELEGASKALPLYIAYRNEGGIDAEILGRCEELQKAHEAWNAQMRALGLDADATATSGNVVAAATASPLAKGYEQYRWTSDSQDWSCPARPSTITLATPEGPREILQVDFEPHPTKANLDKAAIILRRQLALRAGTRLTMMAANRTAKDIRLSIAIKTGAEWVYFESQPVLLKATSSGQEFSQLSFDLSAETFKAKSTGWNYAAKATNLDQVRELQIQIHNGRATGSVWLAGIDFEFGQ